ncbi:MAG: hypothetical protein ACI8WB_000178 [Phenylobacterium sp.]|jgi:hypothetical protein
MIPFTRRELERAWRISRDAAKISPRTNAHRLLLFYAVECGLKAAYIKRNNVNLLDHSIAKVLKHDLNGVMDKLNVSGDLRIPQDLSLHPCSDQTTNAAKIQRQFNCSELNQTWRYGGKLNPPNDDEKIEKQLEMVAEWIDGELR